jgi:hypothetical protein
MIAALVVALAAASPAAAQSIIPRTKPASADHAGNFRGDVARRFIDDFAACLLGRRPKAVAQALALPSGSSEQNEAFGKLVTSECISSGEVHFDGEVFRGGFYTALVRKKFGKKSASLGEEPVDYTEEPTPGGGVPPSPEIAGLLNFASCVVHKDPQNSRIAVISTAGSTVEDGAMTELAKIYGQCLYADTTFRFSKASLIGFLAEAYYREGSASMP